MTPPAPREYCKNCHTLLDPSRDACPACGRLTVQIVQTVRERGYSRTEFTLLRAGLALLALCLLGLFGFAVWLGVNHWSERRQAELLRQQQERQRRILRTLAALRKNGPLARYALYPASGGSAPFNARLSTCRVNFLNVSRDGDTMSVSVNLTGIKPEAQAPVVNVAVYDEDGNILTRAAIVKFAFATLGQGDVRDIEDTMPVPSEETPVFVSVDEDG